MFKKLYRFRGRREIDRAFATGRQASTRLMALYVAERGDARVLLAAVAGRRLGGAVVRNRVRRRIREAVRPLIEEIRPGRSLVFVARTAAVRAPFPDLCDSVRQLLRQVGAIGE